MSPAAGSIGVVHLVWRPLGVQPLADFVAAYRRHPAGVPHRLFVVFNGFAGEDRTPYERVLADTEHDALVLPESVQDLPAYLAAARAIDCEAVCFTNSYSTPLAAGWLAALHAQLSRPGVGLVGASGSWESHYDNSARLLRSPPRAALAWMLNPFRPPERQLTLRTYLEQRRAVRDAKRVYGPFPTPHLRTNAFMLRRELMLSLRWPPMRTKADAYAFESGCDGLTRQVLARGLRVLVVGRDGRGFEPADWSRSGTYRCGDQPNLLVADNRTREYDAYDAAARARVVRDTWGRRASAHARDLGGPALGRAERS